MTATVRLNDNLDKKLENLSKILHKKKSDVIREAISFYSESIENSKKSRIKSAVEKTKNIDKKVYKDLESSLDDTI